MRTKPSRSAPKATATNPARITVVAALMAALVTIGLTATPPPARAVEPCHKWEFDKPFKLRQYSESGVADVETDLKGAAYTGTATRIDVGPGVRSTGRVLKSEHFGSPDLRFFLAIQWPDELVYYSGHIDPYTGSVNGDVVDTSTESTVGNWDSGTPLRCLSPKTVWFGRTDHPVILWQPDFFGLGLGVRSLSIHDTDCDFTITPEEGQNPLNLPPYSTSFHLPAKGTHSWRMDGFYPTTARLDVTVQCTPDTPATHKEYTY